MDKTCCPQYTIRTPVAKFKPSKSQKKVLRRVSKELDLDTSDLNSWQEVIKAHLDSKKLTVETVAIGNNTQYTNSKEKSHALYKKYQIEIHKDKEDELDVDKWKRFLCNPPKNFGDANGFEGTKSDDFNQGAYHQQYYLNDKLIAVGVVDITPNCLSSVYMYYDPDFSRMSLGTYTGLVELYFCSSYKLPYYYLGYYIHNCPKMKYKAQFKPSFLLCPETFTWREFDSDVDKLLTEEKYSRLSVDVKKRKFDTFEEEDFWRLGILFYKYRLQRAGRCSKKPKKYEMIYRLLGSELADNLLCVYTPESEGSDHSSDSEE